MGFCDETEDKQEEDKEETFDQTDEKEIQSIGVYTAARAGETVYTKAIERGIGAIDVVAVSYTHLTCRNHHKP